MTPAGVISLDYAGSHRWTGTHNFSGDVVFSPGQRFQVSSLQAETAPRGSLVAAGTTAFEVLIPQGRNKVLVYDGVQSKWSRIHLQNHVEGVLPTQSGGTGHAEYRRGDLLFAMTETLLETLPIGTPGDVLTAGRDGRPTWSRSGNIRGELSPGRVPYCNSGMVLVDSPLSVVDAGLAVDLTYRSLILEGPASDLTFNVSRSEARLNYGSAVVSLLADGSVDFGGIRVQAGKLVEGRVPAEVVEGVLSQAQGGTGLTAYRPGDLLHVDCAGKVSRLPAPGRPGLLLVSGPAGLPEWSENTAAISSPADPGVRFEEQAGALFVLSKNARRRLLFAEDDRGDGVQAVVRGGTGSSLTGLRRGSIVVGKSDRALTVLNPGPAGSFLVSSGVDKAPRWLSPPAECQAGLGLTKLDGSYSLDLTYAPTWQSRHHFASDINIGASASAVFDGGDRSTPPIVLSPATLKGKPAPGAIWSDGDELFFATRRGVRALLSPPVSHPTIIAVPICNGCPAVTDSLLACVSAAPSSPASPGSPCRWKLLRLEVTVAGDSPPPDLALQLHGPAGPLLEHPLDLLSAGHHGSSGFVDPHLRSSDVLSLRLTTDWPAGHLSAYLVMEALS